MGMLSEDGNWFNFHWRTNLSSSKWTANWATFPVVWGKWTDPSPLLSIAPNMAKASGSTHIFCSSFSTQTETCDVDSSREERFLLFCTNKSGHSDWQNFSEQRRFSPLLNFFYCQQVNQCTSKTQRTCEPFTLRSDEKMLDPRLNFWQRVSINVPRWNND